MEIKIQLESKAIKQTRWSKSHSWVVQLDSMHK